jgi:predicted Zn-dependent protease
MASQPNAKRACAQVPVEARAGLAGAVLFCLTILLVAAPSPAGAACCQYFGGPIVIDPDLDLPANPTIEQQVTAGHKQLERIKGGDPSLDSNQELVAYFNDLAKRLLAAQNIKPPYAIVVHVSTGPRLNAFATVGGQVVLYSRIFEQADNEAQLVAILGHELSHELHDDYAFFWTAARNQEDSYGPNGLLEKSREIEMRADLDATRMMYGAGWDPQEQIKMMTRLAKLWQNQRDNHRVFYSTHPDDAERISAVKKLIARLPPKPGLATDSEKFEKLKRSL